MIVSGNKDLNLFKILNQLSAGYLRYNYPLSILNEKNEPEQIGTFVILSVGGENYLVTAAHAAKDCLKSGFLCFHNDGTTYFQGTAYLDEADTIDIGILKIDKIIGAGSFNIIREDMIFDGIISPDDVCSIMGFPATKTRLDRRNYLISSKNYVYYGLCCDHEIYLKNMLNEKDNIAVEFIQKECVSHENIQFTFPSPNGMSGGSIWYYDMEKNKVFFAGIATTHKKNECIYGTRTPRIKSEINKFQEIIRSRTNPQ